MNKKGSSGEWILWVFRIIGTLFIVGFIVTFLNSSIKANLELDDLRFYTFTERILYSPDCFISDENVRAMPGVIDKEKFVQESVSDCMLPLSIDDAGFVEGLTGMKPSIGARLTLHYKESLQEKETILFYNKEYFEDIKPLTFSSQYLYTKKRYFVLVKNQDDLIPGNLLVEVAWRK